MTPAAFFVAAVVAIPSPAHVNRADMLVRFPELGADVAEADRPALLAAARRLELFGPFDAEAAAADEFSFVPLDSSELLDLLRDLFAELRDAPPLADSVRLPHPAGCHAASEFNRGLARGWRLRAEWEADRAELLLVAAAEADRYADFWVTAMYAASEGGPWYERRRCLAELRATVGAEAWAAGRLPDAAPFHLLAPRSR